MTFARLNPPRREYTIEVRSANGEAWRAVDSASSLARAREAMLGAEGIVSLRQGDLVRVADATGTTRGLAVMTLARGVVLAPPAPKDLGKPRVDWFAFWEGPKATARAMLFAADKVDGRRLILAAAALARDVLPSWQRAFPDDKRPENAIDTAEKVARGSAQDARKASMRAYAASAPASAPAGSSAAYAAYAAANAASAAYAYASYTGDSARGGVVYYADAAVGAASSAAAYAAFADAAYSRHAAIVRRWIPLSVVMLAELGEHLPIEFGARENPRRRPRKGSRLERTPVPRFVQDCVVAVAPKRGVRAAFAICYASAKNGGRIRWGSTKLTQKGQRVERSLARRPGAKKRVERFEKVLATARAASKRRPRPNPWPRVQSQGVAVDAESSFVELSAVPGWRKTVHARRVAYAGAVLAEAAIDELSRNGEERDDLPRLTIEAAKRVMQHASNNSYSKSVYPLERDLEDSQRRNRVYEVDRMSEAKRWDTRFQRYSYTLAWLVLKTAQTLLAPNFSRTMLETDVAMIAREAPWAWEAFGESQSGSQHRATEILFRALGEPQ